MRVVLIPLVICAVILVSVFLLGRPAVEPTQSDEASSGEHVYATWDTMEFDKCVAAWLIVRFISKEATFVFLPVGSQIRQGTPFDVPQSPWRRQHKKCASDCVLESLEIDDPAVEKIVEIAHQIELNYWRYQQFPDAKKCQEDFREIQSKIPDPNECLEKMLAYLDELHQKFEADMSLQTSSSKQD